MRFIQPAVLFDVCPNIGVSISYFVLDKGYTLSFLSPFSYFSAAEISHTGFYAWDYLACYVLLAAIFLIAAYRLFLKKDVQFRS